MVDVGSSHDAEPDTRERAALRSSDQGPAAMPDIPGWVEVVAPSTIVPALVFYLGWQCTNAVASYFGVDPGLLGLSAQDYALRSADVLFIPMGVLLTAALLAIWLHSLILHHVSRQHRRGCPVPHVLMAVGAGLFLLGATAAWGGLPFATPFLLPQLSPGLGIGLLAYGASLRRYRLHLGNGGRRPADAGAAGHLLRAVLVVMLVLLSLLWTVSVYATALGTGRAEALAAQLRDLPGAVVYAREQLHIDAPGVVVDAYAASQSSYRYRYRGLRLLLATADTYVLVPAIWTRETGVTVVLPRTQVVHLEFTTAGLP